jgi:hypothetical protein
MGTGGQGVRNEARLRRSRAIIRESIVWVIERQQNAHERLSSAWMSGAIRSPRGATAIQLL